MRDSAFPGKRSRIPSPGEEKDPQKDPHRSTMLGVFFIGLV